MKKSKWFSGSLAVLGMMLAGSFSAFAMPADIEEAVTAPDYNAYAHSGAYEGYSDSELIPIKSNYVATAEAMIRVAPFGDILGSVVPGQSYYVVGECPDCMWYKISGSVSGYVYASYMVPESQYVPATNSNSDEGVNIRSLDMLMTITDASEVNVRTEPSSSADIVAVAKKGEEIHVTGNVLDTEWYQCKYKGETVYICDDYLTPELPQTMTCMVKSELNIHTDASSDTEVIGTLKQGDKVRVSAKEDDWLRFSMEDGKVGYVYDEYMAVVE